MKPTISYMVNKFNEFNKTFFSNSLPIPIFELMSRKTALGDFTSKKNSNYIRIRLNKTFDRPLVDLDTTLIHEMIHQYIYVNNIYDNSAHGTKFLLIARKIYEKSGGLYNITATTTIKDEQTFLEKDKKRIIVFFDNDKFSVIHKNSLTSFLELLIKKNKKFYVYESDFIYFKQFKTCISRITYYMINEKNKRLIEDKILPQSKNITTEVFLNKK